MSTAEPPPRSRRETRLLVVTIAVSVGVLLLLAQFRFPEDSVSPAEAAPAPLERLAARAAYDELASTMADLERRIVPRLITFRIRTDGPSAEFGLAARVTADRALSVLPAPQGVDSSAAQAPLVLSRDLVRDLAVLQVPTAEDSILSPRTGTRTGPRYIALAEATAHGVVLRPVYIGRSAATHDPGTDTPLISLSGLQHPVRRGDAVFSLDGGFIGLVHQGEAGEATVVPADFLAAAAQNAQPSNQPAGDLGVQVQPLSELLSRATGTEAGVVVAHVSPSGPAAGVLRSGDVIHSIDTVTVTTAEAFRQLERTRAPGAAVTVGVVRERKPQQITIQTSKTPAIVPSHQREDSGIVGRTVSGAGVEVITVVNGSPAARAGLRRGDLIVFVGSEQQPDTEDLATAFRALPPAGALLLGIQREGTHHVLAMEKRE
jgi:S1-C subfamily serine protease